MSLPIILASSSPYRKAILEKINLRFTTDSPDIDENRLKNETHLELVKRLSIEKSKALSSKYPNSLIIGSDQIAVMDGVIIGKPKNHDDAVDQLKQSSGSVVYLYAGVSLFNTKSQIFQYEMDTFEVEFKEISARQIQKYLEIEKPYDCCGSLKAEGIGISLLSRLTGNDPNTLIGLPLIKLIGLLENEAVSVLK